MSDVTEDEVARAICDEINFSFDGFNAATKAKYRRMARAAMSRVQSAQSTPPVESDSAWDSYYNGDSFVIVTASGEHIASLPNEADTNYIMGLHYAALTPPPVTASVEPLLWSALTDLHEGLTADLPQTENGWLLRRRFQDAERAVQSAIAALKEGHSLSTVIREEE